MLILNTLLQNHCRIYRQVGGGEMASYGRGHLLVRTSPCLSLTIAFLTPNWLGHSGIQL